MKPELGIVITSFKRPDLAVACVAALRRALPPDLPVEWIVSDDGSPPADRRELLRNLETDVLVLADENRGLPASLNRAVALVRAPLILYVQEDFVCEAPSSDWLTDGLAVLDAMPELTLVRYWGAEEAFVHGNHRNLDEVHVVVGAERLSDIRHHYLYSDTPHLARTAAVRAVGTRAEDLAMDESEQDYGRRWQRTYGAATFAWLPEHAGAFRHAGAGRSARRERRLSNLRQRWSRNAAGRAVLWCYDLVPRRLKVRLHSALSISGRVASVGLRD